jgi:hypothetical protein
MQPLMLLRDSVGNNASDVAKLARRMREEQPIGWLC